MKLIMENWRKYLNEQDLSSNPERAMAIVWNNSSYRPFDEEVLSNIPKIMTPSFLENIPQGHAGIVLIKENNTSKAFKSTCISYDFGAGRKGKCDKKNTDDMLLPLSLRKKAGLYVWGEVKKSIPVNLKYNIFDAIENSQEDIIYAAIKQSLRYTKQKADQIGIIPNINFEAAREYALNPSGNGRCSFYTVIPGLESGGIKGDNCGTYALKVAAAGLGKNPNIIAEDVIGPDEMLGKMQDVGWIQSLESINLRDNS